jgi:hypothetical protein
VTRQIAIVLIPLFSILFSINSWAAPKTLTGTLTDTMCGKKHMIAGKSDGDCTRECMKSTGSWTYGLLIADKLYSLVGDDKQFSRLAGERVNITGEVVGTRIAVQSIHTAK